MSSTLYFVVRIWWPLGLWLQPFSLEVALLPQYVSFYLLGVIAYRRNWFAELSPRMGRDWWRTTIVAILVAVLFMTLGGGDNSPCVNAGASQFGQFS